MKESIGRRISRITAVVLTAAMLFSTAAFYDGTAWAEPLPADENTVTETGTAQEDSVLTGDELTDSDQEAAEPEETGDEEDLPVLKAQDVNMELTLSVVRKSGRELTLEWTGPKKIDGAASCYLYVNGSKNGTKIAFSGSEEKLSYKCTGLKYSTQYTFSVTYFDGNGKEIISSGQLKTRSAVEPPQKRLLSSFVINDPPRLLWNGSPFNLRQYAGEPYNGCAVVQGSCIDNKGEYSYYCLNNDDDYGRIVKVRMSDNSFAGVSNKFYFAHGNGMCFDSKRNRVVVASYINKRKTITFVDPNNLNNIVQKNVTDGGLKYRMAKNNSGITALAYNAKYDCYIAMQKGQHNIIIYDAETLDAKAASLTDFGAYTGTFQSIDADDTYVYFLLSKDGDAQPNNVLVAFDWHAEKYENLMNGNTIEDIWVSGTNGQPSLVITIYGANEIESLYHTDAGNGRGHFYLVNYDNAPTYKTTVTATKWKKVWKKVKKKVKWKKVWKKVKVLVLKNGQYKWKTKKKKVWKYKTKKKKKKVWIYKYHTNKKFSHYDRDSFVMDLGVF